MRPRKHGVGWSNINLRGLAQIVLCGLIQNSLEIKRIWAGPKTLRGFNLTKLDWAKIIHAIEKWAKPNKGQAKNQHQ